jgi:hypothetical protein
MEDLFTTHLTIQDQPVAYRVVFEHEAYRFLPADENTQPTFALLREHDQWITEGAISAELKQKAAEALDAYLLQQH